MISIQLSSRLTMYTLICFLWMPSIISQSTNVKVNENMIAVEAEHALSFEVWRIYGVDPG